MPTGFEGSGSPRPGWVRWSLDAWVVLVLTFTLLPRWWSGTAEGAVGATPSSVNLLDFTANVALFIPAGVALILRGLSWRRVLVVAAVFSTAIELAQLVLPVDRDAQLTDVIANTAGAAIGCVVVLTVRAKRR